MGTWVSNSYVKVPCELDAEKILQDVHAYLLEACERDENLARTWSQARLRQEKGFEWICLYQVGFDSMKESAIIEVLRSITQKYVDEIVMLNCFGVVSSGAYGHFVEGALVRFVAQCEDWNESVGTPEDWESELIPPMGGLHEGTRVALGKKLQLREVANHSLVWNVDIPLFQ